jgi:hypothetical protein
LREPGVVPRCLRMRLPDPVDKIHAARQRMEIGGARKGGELRAGYVELGERERFGEGHRVLRLDPVRFVDRDVEALVLARRRPHLKRAGRDDHHLGAIRAVAKGLRRRGAGGGLRRRGFWRRSGLRDRRRSGLRGRCRTRSRRRGRRRRRGYLNRCGGWRRRLCGRRRGSHARRRCALRPELPSQKTTRDNDDGGAAGDHRGQRRLATRAWPSCGGPRCLHGFAHGAVDAQMVGAHRARDILTDCSPIST